MVTDKVSEMFDFIFELTAVFPGVVRYLVQILAGCWLSRFFCGYFQSLKADAKIIL
jgi:hypothetical protein